MVYTSDHPYNSLGSIKLHSHSQSNLNLGPKQHPAPMRSNSSASLAQQHTSSSPLNRKTRSRTSSLSRIFRSGSAVTLNGSIASPIESPRTSSSHTFRHQPSRSRSSTLSSVDTSSQDYFGLTDTDNNVMSIIEPGPVKPPPYKDLLPGGCPKFPIYSHQLEGSEQLPSYKPTVYKVAILQRKMEWLSPYEPANGRAWKDAIVELNNTRLNIYGFDSRLLDELIFRMNGKTCFDEDFITLYNSSFTTKTDLVVLQCLKQLGFMREECLIASHSLQYAKFGSASDYLKRKHVLRLRCETSQFLLQFSNSQSMIDWNLALSLARDNSLDIQSREMPFYRTVPRRTRRNTNPRILSSTETRSSDAASRYRSRSMSDFFRKRSKSGATTPTLPSSLNERLNLTISSSNDLPLTPTVTPTISSSVEHSPLRPGQKPKFLMGQSNDDTLDEIDCLAPVLMENDIPEGCSCDDTVDEAQNQNTNHDDQDDLDEYPPQDEDDDDEDEDEEEEERLEPIEQFLRVEDLNHDLDMVHLSASTSPSIADSTQLTFSSSNVTGSSITTASSTETEIKWRPINEKIPSRRRIIRDSIKCIQHLPSNETWSGKLLVKPARRKQSSIASKLNKLTGMGISTTGTSSKEPLRVFLVTPRGLLSAYYSNYLDKYNSL
ncbi:hypothetical protein PP7435_CHR1-0640 [Komagataella phaffii CBS 7435]|uniref:PH domain-containing protein n=2 Tax=Komagataella phaffii TaxID=460519 RepID=C4QWS3_KOMPG|nr:uncharacterized protein PAS_chr1-1_0320 [Komagataella phaffii GS115]AOA61108.1 GQ67_02904T0 [Komagataella phaffii]CAH2446475.1 hypothetical protein BQ9382_C1-3285 [Komagataella phaffii CBS 7435]AOA66044.1 GQ68_02343T0 [Komagataella phaffii GS115]CAY67696.1 Putative protein of unknown function [Komagataella phaffii GS115]CCA36788.1 hypothetical protein PP7435_CHR1-0640 [Komagataella phaffii CBS 7435]